MSAKITLTTEVTDTTLKRLETEYPELLSRLATQLYCDNIYRTGRWLKGAIFLLSMILIILSALMIKKHFSITALPLHFISIIVSFFGIFTALRSYSIAPILHKMISFSSKLSSRQTLDSAKQEFLPFIAEYHLDANEKENAIRYYRQIGELRKNPWTRPLDNGYFHIDNDCALLFKNIAKPHRKEKIAIYPSVFIFVNQENKDQLRNWLIANHMRAIDIKDSHAR